MKSFNYHPTLCWAAAPILAVSGVIGWQLASPPMTAVTTESATQMTGKRAEHRARPARSSAVDLAARQLASIRLAGSPEARMHATIDLAKSLSIAEIAAWMDCGWFSLRGGPELMLFTKIITDRWQLEDEEGLLTWTLTRALRNRDHITEQFELLEQTVTKLAEKAPQQLIDFFKKHPYLDLEMVALSQIASSRPDLALARFQEILANGNPDSYSAKGLFEELAKSSPEKFANLLNSLPIDFRTEAECVLSQIRMKESFADEMNHLWSRPDGLNIFQQSQYSVGEIGTKILGELANLPPEWRTQITSNASDFIDEKNAEQWWSADFDAAGFTAKDADLIRTRALCILGRENPEEAIRRINELKLDAAARRQFMLDLFRDIPDDGKARDFASQLGKEEEREMIEERFAWENRPARQKIMAETPQEWLKRAGEMDLTQTNGRQWLALSGKWDEENTADLAKGFEALEPQKKQQVAQVIINGLGSYTDNPDNPGRIFTDALRYLVTNPPPSVDGGDDDNITTFLSSSYVIRLSATDPVAASEWVATLPSGKAKFLAQQNLIDNWIQYDPKAAKQWQQSLPATEQAKLEKAAKERNL